MPVYSVDDGDLGIVTLGGVEVCTFSCFVSNWSSSPENEGWVECAVGKDDKPLVVGAPFELSDDGTEIRKAIVEGVVTFTRFERSKQCKPTKS